MRLILYKRKEVKLQIQSALDQNKKVVLLTNDRIGMVAAHYLSAGLKGILIKPVNGNWEISDDTVYFLCTFRNIDNLCERLTKKKQLKEGMNLFCLKPFLSRAAGKQTEWKSIEYFDAEWEKRISQMSKYIPNDAGYVFDMGCGEGRLRKYISHNIHYIGVDYIKRDRNTVVCDFNKHEFPDVVQSVNENKRSGQGAFFMSGCLEYIEDVDWVFSKMCRGETIILSYNVLEHNPSLEGRMKLAWKNHLTAWDIEEKMFHNGYICVGTEKYGRTTIIFCFSPKND